MELGAHVVAKLAEGRRPVPRQHVERIGEIAPAVLRGIRSIADEIAQTIERELKTGVGHGKAALARAGEEVADVGVEPHIITPYGPQPERAVRALARKQPVDGVAN